MNQKYEITTSEGHTLIQATVEDLHRRIAGYPPVPTGIPELDALTGGLRRHRFYAVYTNTPFYPTDVALQVAYGAALAAKRVLFVSVERQVCSFARQLVLSLAGLRYDSIIRNDTAEMMSRLPMVESAAEQVKRLKITFMEASEGSLEFILHKIAKQSFACPPDLVVVDAFQMPECMYEKTRVGDFMAEGEMWREFAHRIDAPVFAVDSPIRYQESFDPHSEPHKMRGFGALEEHADTLMLLYSMARATQDNDGVACLQVFKNADGEKHDVAIQGLERYPMFCEQRWRGGK